MRKPQVVFPHRLRSAGLGDVHAMTCRSRRSALSVHPLHSTAGGASAGAFLPLGDVDTSEQTLFGVMRLNLPSHLESWDPGVTGTSTHRTCRSLAPCSHKTPWRVIMHPPSRDSGGTATFTTCSCRFPVVQMSFSIHIIEEALPHRSLSPKAVTYAVTRCPGAVGPKAAGTPAAAAKVAGARCRSRGMCTPANVAQRPPPS